MRLKKRLSLLLAICMCTTLLASIGVPARVSAAATEYEEMTGITGKVHYGDFVWGHWYFEWNEDKARELSGGKLQSEGSDASLTTDVVYTHGDIVMIGLDQAVTFKKLELKSAAAGQLPYKFKLEYSNAPVGDAPGIPQPTTTIGEYTGYDASGDTLVVELDEPVTARAIWLQALTNGADQEPGAAPWSVSDIHFYKESFSVVPDKLQALTAGKREEQSLSLQWTPANENYASFDIYRSDREDGDYVKIASTSSAEYTDTGLSRGTTYFYKVKVVNAIGESEFSDTLSMKTTTTIKDVAIDYADGDVTLAWSAEKDAESYEVYRATGKYSSYERIGTTATTTYVDKGVENKYLYYYKVLYVNGDGAASDLSGDVSLEGKLFGDTMTFYSPTDDSQVINEMTADTAARMMPMAAAEFSTDRYAYLFKPGSYNVNRIDIGYYTSVYGLGATPLDTIVPRIEIPAQGHNSLTNFWRSVENIGIDTGDPANEVKFAASQAAPARRLYVNGKLMMDDNAKYASGGFLADSLVTGETGSYSQQQYFLRNNTLKGSWFGGVWNMLFVGVDNAPAESENWQDSAYASFTVEAETPTVQEKPFLYLNDQDDYAVFVPSLRKNAVGVSWSEDNIGPGKSISIDDFYVAQASVDTADKLNAALSQGKHLLFTPGIYEVDKPIKVDRENTVVLGIGLATISPTSGNDAMQVADVGGVVIAGLLFDAGIAGSEHLLQVGPEGSSADHSASPTLLSDVFTRVGGAVDGKADVTVEINSHDVIGDHFWLWRADHGKQSDSTGWTKNVGKNGVIVNGDDVTIYGLFVEHFQEYQTLWNGERGRTYFYQSEIPYDPPYQSDFMSHNGTVKGYSSYKVSDHVQSHYAVGLGIYDVFNQTIGWVELENAIEVPDGTRIKNAAIVSLGARGGTNHVVNGVGGPVSGGQAQKKGVNLYFVERLPIVQGAEYDGTTGILKLAGKNFDTDKWAWENVVLKSPGAELVMNDSMIDTLEVETNEVIIQLKASARRQIADLFNYLNGTVEQGLLLKADYTAGGTESLVAVSIKGLARPDTSGGNPSIPSSNGDVERQVDILLNGNKNGAATARTESVNGRTITKVSLNEELVTSHLTENMVITLPISIEGDVVAELSVPFIQALAAKQAVLELRTEQASVHLPIVNLPQDGWNDQALRILIGISASSDAMVQAAEKAAQAGSFELLAPPVEFYINVQYADRIEEIHTFGGIVKRTITIPEGVDPNKVSTGIVVEGDGIYRPIPTRIVTAGDKKYAVMSSLTNSSYALVSSDVEFSDLTEHWAREAVTNLAGRLIVSGVDGISYLPNRQVTRAEFAAMLVRALGLDKSDGKHGFTDVNEADWFSSAVNTAYEYGLIAGYEDGSFKPDAAITREQTMIMLNKALALAGMHAASDEENDELLQAFADEADISAWARSSFAYALQAGLVQGRSATTLAPQEMLSRAEAAVLIERLLHKMEWI